MLRFQIPDSYLPGFEGLMMMSPEQVTSLLKVISSMEPGTGVNTFSNTLAEEFPEEKKAIGSLAPMIFSLGSFQPKPEETNYYNELAEGLAKSFKAQFSSDKIGDSQIDALQKSLLRLLSGIDNIRTTFKAYTLFSANERVFREGHIVSDIRLLFKDEMNDKNRSGLVLHRLKIESEEDGQSISYFYSLNRKDLETLRNQVNRALDKEDLIKKDYKEISFINITE